MKLNRRISREEMLMGIAHIASLRGTCDRLQVGAVIARESRPISMGYVGAPAGQPHCHPSVCDASQPCTRTIHAEANALEFARKWRMEIGGCDIFTTDSPCMTCAKLISAAGIERVFYDREYRKRDGIEWLEAHGIAVTQVKLNHAP